MTIKYKRVDMIFAHDRFASDARRIIRINDYSMELVSLIAGISIAAIKDLLSAQHGNPEMRTLLGLSNALDMNPANYFDLAEDVAQ